MSLNLGVMPEVLKTATRSRLTNSENGKPDVAIMTDKDVRFACTRAALDVRMKQLTKQGVDTVENKLRH